MKEQEVRMLDNNDNKAVELFVKLGMPTHIAKTLMFVAQVDECQFVDIEKGANLRQPQVSLAMQELRRRGWVTKKDVRNQGKGRPIHIYASNVDLDNILNGFEKMKMDEYSSAQQDIDELKSLINY